MISILLKREVEYLTVITYQIKRRHFTYSHSFGTERLSKFTPHGNCAHLSHYAASSANFLPTFRDNVSGAHLRGSRLFVWILDP